MPPLSSNIRSNFPEGMESILRKALSKDPIERFRTITEFAEEFISVIQDVPYNESEFLPTEAALRSMKNSSEAKKKDNSFSTIWRRIKGFTDSQ